ncbi:hypothetical protein [Haloarchaeobius sp. TZWWS8]|uniref:hypothetical protein n=1 Tax=Haloarchaeobius sp. TZWWS8 TaxID=3446121 RepID=UPI003EBFB9F2
MTKARPLERRFRYQLLGPLTDVILRSPFRTLLDESLTLARVTDHLTKTRQIARVSVHRLPHGDKFYIVARGNWWRPLTEAGTLELMIEGEWTPMTVTVTERRRRVAEFTRDYVNAYGREAGARVGVLVEGDGEPVRAHYLRALEGAVLLTIENEEGGEGRGSGEDESAEELPYVPLGSER